MFRRDVKSVKELIMRTLREQGLETPLQQKRLVEAWPDVAGEAIARYTLNTYIYNQTLYVRLSNPSYRCQIRMMRSMRMSCSSQGICGTTCHEKHNPILYKLGTRARNLS